MKITVRAFDTRYTAMRAQMGMPGGLGSGHTARVGGYLIESHVSGASNVLRSWRRALQQHFPDLYPAALRCTPIQESNMKLLFIAFSLASTLLTPASAQQKAEDHGAHHPAATSAVDMTAGEVRKVDKDARKMTIKHGEIKNLDMPPMTMVFQVRDSALLDKLKVGDTIRFAAEKTPSGYVVTSIQPAP